MSATSHATLPPVPGPPPIDESLATRVAARGHDLNNVLAAIRLHAEMLDDPSLPWPHRHHLVGRLNEAVDDGFAVATGLLDLGHPARHPSPIIDMNHVVQSVGEVLSDLAGPLIDVVVDVAADEAMVCIDEPDARQVVLNLGRNAIDAIGERGTISLSTTTGRGQRETGDPTGAAWFHLTIADTGHGISPAIADALFQPFVTTRRDGTGLGLAIANDTVTRSGGRIDAEGATGAGAVFTVRLPLTRH